VAAPENAGAAFTDGAASDPMAYLPGMEESEPSLMNAVLAEAAAYNPAAYGAPDVQRALASGGRSTADFAALLSPAAAPFLEEMAHLSQRETRARFGNSVSLFTPLYLANYCGNGCVYCGFNRNNPIRRARLGMKEMDAEMAAIADTGLEEILLLTGESPEMAGEDYLAAACALARKRFRVVGLEVFPLDTAGYRRLRESGADFVTVFQETYDPALYGTVHPAGRKRSFPYRFHAQERALAGGMRGAGFAALLGLGDFRREIFACGLHARLVQRKHPHAEISFSVPRLRPVINNSALAPRGVGERELAQVICALRLFMPFAGITVSTRENARFRDHAVQWGATKLSAGVDTGVGGHRAAREDAPAQRGDSQFEINDTRTVEEVYQALLSRGLQPVMSDYVDV